MNENCKPTKLSELRGIVTVEELEQQNQEEHNECEEGTKIYQVDLGTRKLPPPKAYQSEGEKFAWMLNKNEESFLVRVLDHINTQEKITKRSMERDASVMRVRSARFFERAEQARRQEFEMLERAKPRPKTAGALETIAEEGTQRQNKYLYSAQYKYNSRNDSRLQNIKSKKNKKNDVFGYVPVKRQPEMTKDRHFEPLVLSLLQRQPTTSRNTPSTPVSSLPKIPRKISSSTIASGYLDLGGTMCSNSSDTNLTDKFVTKLSNHCNVASRTESKFSDRFSATITNNERKLESDQSRNSTTNRRKTTPDQRYNLSAAEQQLKRELRQMERKRTQEKPCAPSLENLLLKERQQSALTKKKLENFCLKLKTMSSKQYNKWSLQELQKQLKL